MGKGPSSSHVLCHSIQRQGRRNSCSSPEESLGEQEDLSEDFQGRKKNVARAIDGYKKLSSKEDYFGRCCVCTEISTRGKNRKGGAAQRTEASAGVPRLKSGSYSRLLCHLPESKSISSPQLSAVECVKAGAMMFSTPGPAKP